MSSAGAIALRQAVFPQDTAIAQALLSEYAASLTVDLAFQDFDAELADLGRQYGPPRGALFLAEGDGQALGCVGLRGTDAPGIAELKRLYVRPDGRGHALGRRLSQAAIEAARVLGYRAVRLDTLPDMRAAQALYAGLGFVEIAPYRHNPVPGTRYLELRLPTA